MDKYLFCPLEGCIYKNAEWNIEMNIQISSQTFDFTILVWSMLQTIFESWYK